VGHGLAQLERGLKHDRDLLPFDLEEDRAIRSLLDFLRSGRIEVRRYEGHFLHAKAFVFRGAERGILAGSANLTRARLQTNLELVLGHHEDPLVARVEEWFESLWRDAVPFDLAAVYAELLAEVPPYLAEGMNLQQCRNVVNYDLPWNPMRLVQRHGRVDRIGSQHLEVVCVQ
jgi:phosphatidylserine/phosphatidylglycerophosphate/cardiolipin synthase-like enzyme